MRRIRDIVEAEVRRTPFLEEGLAAGIINHSALARRLRPVIERELVKPASQAAVMMAIRRVAPARAQRAAKPVRFGEITLRSHLTALTYQASPHTGSKVRRLFDRLSRRRSEFVTYTQGVSEVMVVVSADAEDAAAEAMTGEHQIARLRHLAALVIRLAPSTVRRPGVYYGILKQLSWRSINVVDVVSTFTEFTIVVEDKDVDAAFAALREAVAPV
jgi:aspartokinase